MMDIALQQPLGKIIALSLAAILGVNARYWLGIYFQHWLGPTFPWGTLIINLTGCLLLGFLMGITAIRYQGDAATQMRLIIGTGFLGTLHHLVLYPVF